MAVDRSKFKPTSAAKMAETSQATESAMGAGGASRPGMIKLKPGKNTLRIFPAHPDTDGDFCKPSVKTFLPMMVKERDSSGKETGNEKEGSKPIFNARVHGGKDKDLVEEYIKLARVIAEAEIKDSNLRQAFLDKVYGKFVPGSQTAPKGINYKAAYVMYAKNVVSGEFGRLEVGKSVKDMMNKISANEADGEPMGVDPFTDVEDGRALLIVYDKEAKKAADYYTTSLDTSIDKVTKMATFYPISDEELEKFAAQPTLESMYSNVFTRKDFLLQVEGLQFFDKKNDMKIWNREEWIDVLEEISAWYPETPVDVTDEEPEEGAEEVDDEKDEVKSDQFDLMSRTELKALNVTNKYGIVVKQSMSDDDLRQLVRAASAKLDIPNDPLPGEPGYSDEEPDDAPPVKTSKASALDKLKTLGKK
jgi:hypothetical protein